MSNDITQQQEVGERKMDIEPIPGQQPATQGSKHQRTKKNKNSSHRGPKPFHKPKTTQASTINQTQQVFIDANQEGSFPHHPDTTDLNNINAEMKQVSGVIYSLIDYFVSKYNQPSYQKDKNAAKRCFSEVRHHLGVTLAAYLRSAKHTTMLPEGLVNILQMYAYHDLYIDGGSASIINSFMPIQGTCQLNVADVVHRFGLWFELTNPLLQAINAGKLDTEQQKLYNSLLSMEPSNFMIQALVQVQSVQTVYVLPDTDRNTCNMKKLDPRTHFTQVRGLTLPTFVFERGSTAASLSKGRIVYTQKVRSIKYASRMDGTTKTIRYVGQPPTVAGEVMAMVNSTMCFWFGFTTFVQPTQPRCVLDNIMYMNPFTVQQSQVKQQKEFYMADVSRCSTPMSMNENNSLVLQQQNQTSQTIELWLYEEDGISSGIPSYTRIRGPLVTVQGLLNSNSITLNGYKITSVASGINLLEAGLDLVSRQPNPPPGW